MTTTTREVPIQLSHDVQLNPEPSKTHLTSKGKKWAAGVALATTVLAVKGGYDSVKFVQAERHKNAVAEEFAHPGMIDHLQEEHINPDAITKYTIHEGDNPTDIAKRLHATDIGLVKSIISDQEGGDRNLHVGDTVVLPNELLAQPPLHTPVQK